jgi:hypothetical protein
MSEGFAMQAANFEARVEFAGVPSLRLSGTADAPACAPLEQTLERLHGELVALGSQRCDLDLTALEFMTATSFKVLATWIGRIQELAPDKRYRVHIRSNRDHAWQARSLRTLRMLQALASFAVELVVFDDG